MSKPIEYSVRIVWSKADQAYLAAVPELPGCLADGPSPEDALKNVRVIAGEWIETAKKEGRDISRPQTVEDIEKASEQAQKQAQVNLNTLIRRIIGEFVQKELPSIVEAAIHREQVSISTSPVEGRSGKGRIPEHPIMKLRH